MLLELLTRVARDALDHAVVPSHVLLEFGGNVVRMHEDEVRRTERLRQ